MTSEIARPQDVNLSADEMAATKFLIRYNEPTRTGYQLSLKQWFQFCADHSVRPLEAERAYVELWMRSMEQRGLMASTINGKLNPVVGFYKLAKIDRVIKDNPCEHLRRPSVPQESRREGLTRAEGFACLEAAAQIGPLEHALWAVMLLLGPRVGEVCRLDCEDIGREHGQPTIFMDREKGNRSANVPLVPRASWALETYLGSRNSGPLFLKPRKPVRLDGASSNRIVKRVAKQAGITKHVTNHSLRHSFVTAALNAGANMRDLQNSMGYADMRQLSRYDRDKANMARHSTHLVSTFFEGA
jgi:site-specific recombinase XerD